MKILIELVPPNSPNSPRTIELLENVNLFQLVSMLIYGTDEDSYDTFGENGNCKSSDRAQRRKGNSNSRHVELPNMNKALSSLLKGIDDFDVSLNVEMNLHRYCRFK